MKSLYVEYSEFRTGGELENPDEMWSDRTPSYTDVTFLSLLREQKPNKMFYDSVTVSDATYESKVGYLAVIRYSTGDTFGTSHGAWHIVGVATTQATAERMLKDAMSSIDGYKPWEGYFEKFERTEIHQLDIK